MTMTSFLVGISASSVVIFSPQKLKGRVSTALEPGPTAPII